MIATIKNNLADITQQLEHDPDAISWMQRRRLVMELADRMEQEGSSPEIIAVLQLLVSDPKCEVRKAVADLLLLLPDRHYPKFVVALLDDHNAYVQQSAQRAYDHRKREARAAERKRQRLEHIERQFARLEKRHGKDAAQVARRMAERHYEVLVGATIHDMRNIVGPLQSWVVSLQQQLDDHQLDPCQLRDRLKRMRHAAERLDRMLADMKTYSRAAIESHRRERVESVIEESVRVARDALKAAGRLPDGVQVRTKLGKRLVFVVARDHLVRAISNIIKNAYEAFAVSSTEYRSGLIDITARLDDSQKLEIVIRDDGLGIVEDDLAQVRKFTPGGTSKADYGTGFGLPIARRLIKAHEGSLTIDSEDGKGTVVTITLPVQQQETH